MLLILLFIYLLVALRVMTELFLVYFRLRKSEQHRLISNTVLRKIPSASLLWPLDFIHIPKVFLKAYLFRDAKSMVQLGFYYGQKK